MALVWIIVGFIVVIGLLKVLNDRREQSWKRTMGGEDIPVLPGEYPILGHLPTLISYPPDNHFDEHEKNYKKLKTSNFIVRAPGVPLRTYILTIDPDVVKHIASTAFGDVYEKGEVLAKQYEQFFGRGIFNVNGDDWQKQRKDAIGLFHVTKLKSYIDIFSKNADRFFKQVDKVVNTKEYQEKGIDLQDYFMRYTLDSFVEIGFGVSLSSIEEDVNHFAIAFDKVQTHTERRGRLGVIWPLLEAIHPDKDYEMKLKYMNETCYNIIDNRIKQDDETLANSSDALSSIILQARKKNETQSTKELRDFVMNFLIAGRDTTAMLLTWCFYYLAIHPEVESKVIQEIEQVIGDDEVNFENIKKLPYLKCVLQETMRLRPPVPVDGYTAKKDNLLPGGLRVKKGWEVYYLSILMHKREDYFDKPLEFIPERFLNSSNGCKDGIDHKSVYIPFHFGPRTCLGREMAYEEASIMICLTLRNGYRFRMHKGYEPQIKQAILLTAKDGMWMDVTRVYK